ncbi:asparaginase [Rhodobacterales bacterium HKCCE3408]|nr:asparaginase [Rhodobacterales bacterium HKCCE3408]
MSQAETLVTLTRGPFDESAHLGHAVVWRDGAGVVGAWGDPDAVILPRSSCKMIQALPLVESGAADRAGLTERHLAIACASHNGGAIHTDLVTQWLADIGLVETDLRCGKQWPDDREASKGLILAGRKCDQRHNNCSGKHTGFLTLTRDMGAGPEYVDPDHPVQLAVRTAFEDVTDAPSPGFGIDGCSAPNFASTLSGLARAMAAFAAAEDGASARETAMVRLRTAMMAHPELVAGEGRACTRLMRTMAGRAAVKTGAEGVYIAIVPELRIGIAVKIADGAGRGAEAVTAVLLERLGILDPGADIFRDLSHGPILNRRSIEVGDIRPAEALTGWTP